VNEVPDVVVSGSKGTSMQVEVGVVDVVAGQIVPYEGVNGWPGRGAGTGKKTVVHDEVEVGAVVDEEETSRGRCGVAVIVEPVDVDVVVVGVVVG